MKNKTEPKIKLNPPSAPKLRLYVWENVLTDYTDGIMFALAESVEQARELCYQRQWGKDRKPEDTYAQAMAKDGGEYTCAVYLQSEPRIVESAEGFVVWGGG
jgi:hypothetical protein